MNIRPGIGINEIELGMSQTELIKTVGKPDKIISIELINDIRLIYNELMVTFCFSLDEKNKLYFIECANPEIRLWNQKIIGMGRDDLVQLLYKYEMIRIEYYDYEIFEVIYCEDIGVEFILEFNIVQKVTIGVLFDATGEIKWNQ